MSSLLSDFFSSVFSSEPIYNDEAPAPEQPESSESEQPAAEEKEEEQPAEEEEEEEEDEPEDLHPTLREDCAKSAQCAPSNKHFEHCTETVNEGKGFKHEDCVEELFQQNCVAPKLWSKLA